MAVVMRGWSKTASTALKLATAERIIGYQFKNVDKLYEALDQTALGISLPSGKTTRVRPRNSRLALVGDALGQLHMARDWYDRASLSGVEFTEIHASTLSNERLGKVGFRLGLNECAISKDVVRPYDMATTIEALIAAVEIDGASQTQVRRVCKRFGLEHKLLEPAERLWIWEIVSSKLDLPARFFIGHHFKLQGSIFETQLKPVPARKRQGTWLWGRAERLWSRAKELWEPRKEAQQQKRVRPKRTNRRASRSTTQPPGNVVPLAKRSQSAATTIAPVVDESTSKTECLVEDSGGHHEDVGKAAAYDKTTETEILADRHGVARLSNSEASRSPMPTNRRPRPILLEEGTSADDAEPAETGPQDSNTASSDEAAPAPSGVAATGTEEQVEHSAHEATEAQFAEATSQDDSKEQLERKTEKMGQEARTLLEAILSIKKAGGKMTEEDKMKIKVLHNKRKRIVDRRSLIISNLKARSQ